MKKIKISKQEIDDFLDIHSYVISENIHDDEMTYLELEKDADDFCKKHKVLKKHITLILTNASYIMLRAERDYTRQEAQRILTDVARRAEREKQDLELRNKAFEEKEYQAFLRLQEKYGDKE